MELGRLILEVFVNNRQPLPRPRLEQLLRAQPLAFSIQNLEDVLKDLQDNDLIAQHKGLWGIPQSKIEAIDYWWSVEQVLRKP